MKYPLALLLVACGGTVDPLPDADVADAAVEAAQQDAGADAKYGTKCVSTQIDASVSMGDPACYKFTGPNDQPEVCQPCPVGTPCTSVAYGWAGVCQ